MGRHALLLGVHCRAKPAPVVPIPHVQPAPWLPGDSNRNLTTERGMLTV